MARLLANECANQEIVITSKARNLFSVLRANSRSLASLVMTM